jgi:hypothetical protein
MGMVKARLYFQSHWLEKKFLQAYIQPIFIGSGHSEFVFSVIMSELTFQCVLTIYHIKRKISTLLVYFVALKKKLCHKC